MKQYPMVKTKKYNVRNILNNFRRPWLANLNIMRINACWAFASVVVHYAICLRFVHVHVNNKPLLINDLKASRVNKLGLMKCV